MSAAADNSVTDDIVETERDSELSQIREALRGLRFGSVSIIVQDGIIVQIDRTEKRRLRQAGR